MTVVFLTLDELQKYGPLALREYLKRNRRPSARGAPVVELLSGSSCEARK